MEALTECSVVFWWELRDLYLTWVINGTDLIVKLLEKYPKLILGREGNKEMNNERMKEGMNEQFKIKIWILALKI